MQFGIGQSQHVRRPARGHEISAGLGGVLREGVGQACGVDAHGRGLVRDRLGGHWVQKIVGVAARTGGLGVGDAGGERSAVAVRGAAGHQIVAQLPGRGHDGRSEFVMPVLPVLGGCANAPTHDVKRIMHAEHDAVVAGLRSAGHDLRRKFGNHSGQRDTPRIGAGSVAGGVGTVFLQVRVAGHVFEP